MHKEVFLREILRYHASCTVRPLREQRPAAAAAVIPRRQGEQGEGQGDAGEAGGAGEQQLARL